MHANLDRFSTGVTPAEPYEVGDCGGCGATIYDYEFATCRACGAEVHEGRREKCEICGADGCRVCLIEDPDTGERRCPENCEAAHNG